MVSSIWETNMKHYSRILKALTLRRSTNRVSLKKLENHILNNLSMSYPKELLLDIFLQLSFSRHPDLVTFQRLQHLLTYSTFDDGPISVLDSKVDTVRNSLQLRKALRACVNIKQNKPQFEVIPDFRVYLIQKTLSPRLLWAIDDWTTISQTLLDKKSSLYFINDNEEELTQKVRGFLLNKLVELLESKSSIEADSEFVLGLLGHLNQSYSEREFLQIWGVLETKLVVSGSVMTRRANRVLIGDMRFARVMESVYSPKNLLEAKPKYKASYDLSQ